MKKLNTLKVVLLGLFVATIASSCEKAYLKPFEEDIKDVSYASQMQPFFNASCATSFCHDGSIKPDLTPTVSYTELTTKGYIDLTTPANSLLYTKIAPGGSMEQHATPSEQKMTLVWIEEGAKNN